MTPNFALGAMCALESSAVLINEIYAMHGGSLKASSGKGPSRVAVSAAFQRYQEERMPRIKAAFDATALLTRMHACDGPFYWFAMRCVFPATGMKPYADALADLCSGAPKINFLPVKYSKAATFKWKDEPDHVPARLSKDPLKSRKNLLMELASILSLVFLVFFVFGSVVDHSLSTSTSMESWAGDLRLNGNLLESLGPVGRGSRSNSSPVAKK
jgi:hypothetical protein